MLRVSDAIRIIQGIRTSTTFPVVVDMKTVSAPNHGATPVTSPITSPDHDVTVCVEELVGSSLMESPARMNV